MVYAMLPQQTVAVSAASGKGKTHRLVSPINSILDLPTNARMAHAATVLCGAYVEVRSGFDQRDWENCMGDYRRLHETHEVGVCARCAKRDEKEGF